MKKILKLFCVIVSASTIFLGCKNKKNEQNSSGEQKTVVASTSWTAAFADLAGIDNVEAIAPASLQHPPEYEITIGDIEKIQNSDVFIYAGFERMMKTIGSSIENVTMQQIQCDNSIATVTSSAMTIAELMGTQTICNERLLNYINTIYDGKTKLQDLGLSGAKVLCNKNQIYLAKELGLEVVRTFGPSPVTSEDIEFASSNDFDFIIDNVHNPVGQPLAEVSPNAKYIVWRNFPEQVERDSLVKVVSANINQLFN